MTAPTVTCPGCNTLLRLSAGVSQFKCPKCGQLLQVQLPPAMAQPQPAPQPAPKKDDLFASLPSPPPPFQRNVAPPPRPVYVPPPKKVTPKKTKKKGSKKRSGSGNSAAKNVAIAFGSIAGVLTLGIAALVVLAATGLIGPRHSGWEEAQYQGMTILMPKGGERKTSRSSQFGTSSEELSGKRRESGSQYTIGVTRLPFGAQQITIDEFIANLPDKLQGQHEVTRDGVRGVAGTFTGDRILPAGVEMEMFVHNNTIVSSIYLPYSKIKDKVGGKMTPRQNERDLDKPQEFFESLKFK